MKKLLATLLLCFSITLSLVHAKPCDNFISGSQDLVDCLQKEYDNSISQGQTLVGQIAYYDSQIKLTQSKISQTEEQIKSVTTRIAQLEDKLKERSALLEKQIVQTYKKGMSDPLQIIFGSGNVSALLSQIKYLQIVQTNNRKFLYDTQLVQTNYAQQKTLIEESKKKLQSLKASLDSYSKVKSNLLIQTKNSEIIYQQLLAQAKAQLAAFSSFAESVGIALIPHQDLSDGWGRYYNQRDSQWGNLLVNNDHSDCRGGSCTLARIGCLVTSYAMVVTHFGGLLTPSDVAVNSSNFWGRTADFNNPGPSANGHAPTRIDNPSTQQLKSALNSESVIIAGLSKNGGPYPTRYSDHWVVLRSVDGDSFRINDPLYAGAMNVSLKDHYSGWTIIQANVYN